MTKESSAFVSSLNFILVSILEKIGKPSTSAIFFSLLKLDVSDVKSIF